MVVRGRGNNLFEMKDINRMQQSYNIIALLIFLLLLFRFLGERLQGRDNKASHCCFEESGRKAKAFSQAHV